MFLSRLTRRHAGAFLLALAWAASVPAASPPAAPQVSVDAITRAVQAVVGLQITAAEEARSAETLGRERSGSES